MQVFLKVIFKLIAVHLIVLAGLANAENIFGKVIGVMDGDTIEILDASKTTHRIRLEGIDAPEKAQPFGARSKQHLSDQVFGRQVDVQFKKTDKYGRNVGKVIVGGKDANLEQIRSGFAWHYKEYQKEQSAADRVAYADAEISARAKKAGLWIEPKAIPPWEWRHGRKNQPTVQSESSGCPCGGASFCTGSRGGEYCVAPNGKKKY